MIIRILAFLLLSGTHLLVSNVATAQILAEYIEPPKHRIYFGSSGYNVLHENLKKFGTASFSGSLLLGYEWKKWPKLSVGADLYQGKVILTEYWDGGSFRNTESTYTVMQFNCRYFWWRKDRESGHGFRFWSSAGIGIYGFSYSAIRYSGMGLKYRSGAGPTYHLELLGFEKRFKWFSMWSSVGYGYQGVLNFGVALNWESIWIDFS